MRAGYQAGDGHRVVAWAIFLGRRTIDWALDPGNIGPFVRCERYRERVMDALMRETNTWVYAVDDVWVNKLTAAGEDDAPDEGNSATSDMEDVATDEGYECVRKKDEPSDRELVEGPEERDEQHGGRARARA